ncbi:MAG: hypothetical protein CMM74_05415 [Rhodospirillaceae bacterium]|nr:hypothetical protein [Rhodospirillaceae bacterium]
MHWLAVPGLSSFNTQTTGLVFELEFEFTGFRFPFRSRTLHFCHKSGSGERRQKQIFWSNNDD